MQPCLITGPEGQAAFIHIPRTGGRSVCQAFGIQRAHLPASVLQELYPETTRFAIVRDPVEQAYSYFQSQHDHLSSVKEFEAWWSDQPMVLISSPRHKIALNPFDHGQWIDDDTVTFQFPDVAGAVAWAATHCGLPIPHVPHRKPRYGCRSIG